MTIEIDNIAVTLRMGNGSICVSVLDNNLLLENQTYNETIEVLNVNFAIVKQYYQQRVGANINSEDLKEVCLKIVLYYFSMYNLWRRMYVRERNRKLTFIAKDFDHPQTNDIIINFFRNRYPEHYSRKCEVMLNMSPDEFKAYEKNRKDFQQMF